MLQQPRTTIRLFSLTILLMSILVLSGCSLASSSTPTPETGTVPPAVTLVTHPNLTEVSAGEPIAISAETSGVNLQIRWRVKRGELSDSEGPSTIYFRGLYRMWRVGTERAEFWRCE